MKCEDFLDFYKGKNSFILITRINQKKLFYEISSVKEHVQGMNHKIDRDNVDIVD